MAEPDRSTIITLLDRLGDPDDAVALEAARALAAVGVDWDRALRSAAADDDDQADAAEMAMPDDEMPPPSDQLAADAALMDQLLARDGLADDTREDLQDLKQAMAAGEFSIMDSRYVRALAKRLG